MLHIFWNSVSEDEVTIGDTNQCNCKCGLTWPAGGIKEVTGCSAQIV
jgi:hypothetical protein